MAYPKRRNKMAPKMVDIAVKNTGAVPNLCVPLMSSDSSNYFLPMRAFSADIEFTSISILTIYNFYSLPNQWGASKSMILSMFVNA